MHDLPPKLEVVLNFAPTVVQMKLLQKLMDIINRWDKNTLRDTEVRHTSSVTLSYVSDHVIPVVPLKSLDLQLEFQSSADAYVPTRRLAWCMVCVPLLQLMRKILDSRDHGEKALREMVQRAQEGQVVAMETAQEDISMVITPSKARPNAQPVLQLSQEGDVVSQVGVQTAGI